jgi:hypothetical protein
VDGTGRRILRVHLLRPASSSGRSGQSRVGQSLTGAAFAIPHDAEVKTDTQPVLTVRGHHPSLPETAEPVGIKTGRTVMWSLTWKLRRRKGPDALRCEYQVAHLASKSPAEEALLRGEMLTAFGGERRA